jgi:hypothetical protein
MIKSITRLEHKIGDRIYHFFCDHDSPVGEVHDALTKFKSHVVSVIAAQDPPAAPKEEIAIPKEEVKE